MRAILYLLLFLLVIFGILYVLTGWSYSDGERAGTVSKFSRRGFVFKTYEGVLNVGGFSGETGSLTPQYFDFSVKEQAVADQITQAVKTGQRVTLHYEEKIFRLPWNGETKYYITGVEFIGPSAQPYGNGSTFPGNQNGTNQLPQNPSAPATATPGSTAPQPATADSTL